MTTATADDSFDPYEPDDAIDVREYVRVLWRDKWAIFGLAIGLAVLLGLVGILVVSPRFRSSATVSLDPVSLEVLLDTTGAARNFQEDLAVEISAATSEEVATALAEDPELSFPFTTAVRATPGSTSSIDLEASAGSSAEATAALDALLAAYLDRRASLGVALVEERMGPIQAQIDELQAGRADARAPLDDVERQLADNPTPAYRAELEAQQANLESQLAATLAEFDNQINATQSQLDTLETVAAAVEAGNRPDGAPNNQLTQGPTTVQTTPGAARLSAIGFVLGIVIGVLVSVGRRALDKSIRSRRSLEAATGHRVLGLIPRVVDWDEDQVQNIALAHPTSPPAEAYRTLRTSLRFLTVDERVHRLLLTSAGEGEGKTTTVANLGVTLARSGVRVLLVDADLRKPRLHEFFGLEDTIGLAAALDDGVPPGGLVQPVEGLDGLWILTAGGSLAESSEHLGSTRAAEVFTELDELADLVLFDAPPVLPVADALELGRQVDAVLLVASAGHTTPKQARLAAELLDQVGAPLVGTVLNGIRRDMAEGHAFEYGYDLEQDDGQGTQEGTEVATRAEDADADAGEAEPASEDDADQPAVT